MFICQYLKVALESSEEAFGEASTSKAAFLGKIAATTATTAQGVTPSTRQNYLIVFNDFGLRLLCIRPRKAYLSPALIWLEEEGLPAAKMEAVEKAYEGEMDKEAVMRRAMEKWKRMSVEEKAVWRARADAKEDANSNQK